MTPPAKKLLSIMPFGNNPAFDAVYNRLGYKISTATSLRKALALIKQTTPDIVVAEFVYSPTYGSQLSNFESLFAAAQNYSNHTFFIALTHADDLHHMQKIISQYAKCIVVTVPATAQQLENSLRSIPDV